MNIQGYRNEDIIKEINRRIAVNGQVIIDYSKYIPRQASLYPLKPDRRSRCKQGSKRGLELKYGFHARELFMELNRRIEDGERDTWRLWSCYITDLNKIIRKINGSKQR